MHRVPSSYYMGDWEHSVLLFDKDAEHWSFTSLLAPIKNQGLISARLRHVYATGSDITFVYNNRVRSYDLASGKLTMNKQVRDAKSIGYPGSDVFDGLIGRNRA